MNNWAILRERVIEEAKSYIGTPFHHNQCVKGAGIDCLWLLVACYRTIGIVPANFNPGFYPHDWHLHKQEERYLKGVEQYAQRLVNGTPPQPGDIALYKIGKCVSHGGIIIGDGLIVHANRKANEVELADMRQFDQYFHSFWTVFPQDDRP